MLTQTQTDNNTFLSGTGTKVIQELQLLDRGWGLLLPVSCDLLPCLLHLPRFRHRNLEIWYNDSLFLPRNDALTLCHRSQNLGMLFKTFTFVHFFLQLFIIISLFCRHLSMSPHSLLALLLLYYLPLFLTQHALIVLERPPIIG